MCRLICAFDVRIWQKQFFSWYGSNMPRMTRSIWDTMVGWLCWGLTSQSTIFQSCRDGAIASWVINQYFRGVKGLAQGHNTATVGLEPRTSRSGVRHSTTEPPRSPRYNGNGCSRQNLPQWNSYGRYLVIIKGYFCLFLYQNVCCWYSLDSYEYP